MPLGSESKLFREPRLSSWISTLPTDSTLNCLLYNSHEYEASFPRMEGTLFLPVEGKQMVWGRGSVGLSFIHFFKVGPWLSLESPAA